MKLLAKFYKVMLPALLFWICLRGNPRCWRGHRWVPYATPTAELPVSFTHCDRCGVGMQIRFEPEPPQPCPMADCVLAAGHRSEEHGDDHCGANGTWWNLAQSYEEAGPRSY